jgi:hypothetical protein
LPGFYPKIGLKGETFAFLLEATPILLGGLQRFVDFDGIVIWRPDERLYVDSFRESYSHCQFALGTHDMPEDYSLPRYRDIQLVQRLVLLECLSL